MPLGLRKQTQGTRKRHGKQKNHKNLHIPPLAHAEQRHHGRHEQQDGQEGDDEAREDVDAGFGVQPDEFVGCAGSVLGGDEEALFSQYQHLQE